MSLEISVNLMVKRLILVLCKSNIILKHQPAICWEGMGQVRVLLSDGMNRKAQKAYKPRSSHAEIKGLIAKLHLITCP